MGRAKQPTDPVNTADLIGTLLHIMSWQLTAALFAGRWLFGSGWFGPQRERAALGVSVALSVYFIVRGRRQLLRYCLMAQHRGQLSWRQALAVAVLTISAGAFATWLFV